VKQQNNVHAFAFSAPYRTYIYIHCSAKLFTHLKTHSGIST